MTSQRTRPEDLAGRWLTRFFIDHLAGERAASPRTIASYPGVPQKSSTRMT